MSNKEIRKKALSRLSYYWVEAEFLFLAAFGIPAAFLTGAYFLSLVLYPDSEAIDFPLDISQLIGLFNSNGVVKAAVCSLPALMIIFLSPLYYGIKWCYYQAAQGKNAPVSGAFYGYFSLRKWGKAILLNLTVMLRKLVYLLPIFAVGGAVYYIFINIFNSTESTVLKALLIIGLILIDLGLSLIYMICTVRFQLIPYFFAEDPEKKIMDIYHDGINAMSGSKGRFAAMQVWFMPLLILCFTGYLAMFVVPFYSMVKSICAAEISGGKLFDEQIEEKKDAPDKKTVGSAV